FVYYFFFVFQAEDGIRDPLVTGVQTCALPIYGQRMPILALNAVGCPEGCRQADVEATEGSLHLVRLPTMLFALGLALVVYAWAAEWMGPRAGLLAFLLAAFQPTILAHGKQVTTDVQAAFFTAGALWAAWRALRLRRPWSWPVPLPLPRVFVLGLDFSYFVQEQPDLGRGNNYVLGRLNTDGVWYAFPLMLLLKTPLGLFALLALAARTPLAGEGGAGPVAWLLLPFSVVTAFYSLLVAPQLGIRYLLPALPFLLLYGARSALAESQGHRRLAGGLGLWCVLSALSYHPHYMSYFNELIGPRLNAYRFLADSNLDWEDRSHDIARFRAEHPEIDLVVEPEMPQAGWILVGANKLVGVYAPERYRWLRENF